jgi:hypothetical protein
VTENFGAEPLETKVVCHQFVIKVVRTNRPFGTTIGDCPKPTPTAQRRDCHPTARAYGSSHKLDFVDEGAEENRRPDFNGPSV